MKTQALSSDGFYWIRDEALSPEFCKKLVDKFEASPDKAPGKVYHGVVENLKKSTDLKMTGRPEFAEEDSVLFQSLSESMPAYVSQLLYCPWNCYLKDTGFNIQRTEPGEFFNWHADFRINPEEKSFRVLTYIWYLNDIHDGGQTEFINGLSVQPKTGRLLFFPAEVSVVHRGVSPVSETKYIVTGWLHGEYP
jgi:hypothetical protein